MFSITGGGRAGTCQGWHRRDLLTVGAVGAMGLSLPDLFRLQPARADSSARKNVIMLMLVGGPPQHETWDPKPDATSQVRGPYGAIETSVPGVRISEILPRTARRATQFSILRTLSHTVPQDHELGYEVLHTGRVFPAGIEFPSAGSVVDWLDARHSATQSSLPGFAILPHAIADTGTTRPKGQSAGFLGAEYDPFVLDADPNRSHFVPADLQARTTDNRERRRAHLRESVDHAFDAAVRKGQLDGQDAAYRNAFALIASAEARRAFSLDEEPDKLRDRYGRTTFGQSCLLARRLVERGVRFVTVNMYETVFDILCWDCHGRDRTLISKVTDLRDHVAPIFDQAYSALLEDLLVRGLYEDTIVVAWGEFGRTPRINSGGGRDHWTSCWSVVMGGGGLKGGQVIGTSDERGALPKDRPIDPRSCVATLYRALGIDSKTALPGPDGRPYSLLPPDVEAVDELFAA